MNLTCDLKMSYARNCPECWQELERNVSAAIRDRGVTGVKLVPVDRCDHESAAQLEARMKPPLGNGRATSAPAPGATPAGAGGSYATPMQSLLPVEPPPLNGLEPQLM